MHINEKNVHCKCINDNTFKQQSPEEIKNSDTITKDKDIKNSINIEAIIEDSTAFKNVTKRKDNKVMKTKSYIITISENQQVIVIIQM